MSVLVIALRTLCLLLLASPILLRGGARRGKQKMQASREGGGRAPLVANLAAVGLFFSALMFSSGSSAAPIALPLALSGCVLAVAGAALVLRSRAELGQAWSLVPKAEQGTSPVTTGPYRLVRHPIYLGFTLLVMGQALAFSSWLALFVVMFAIVPTFAWRARAEETLLSRAFGECYASYRRRTKMIIPYLL